MTDQAKIDDLYERVTAWSERAIESGIDLNYEALMGDKEFQLLVQDLMNQDMDTIMILMGRSIMENPNTIPSWLVDGMSDEIEEIRKDKGTDNG